MPPRPQGERAMGWRGGGRWAVKHILLNPVHDRRLFLPYLPLWATRTFSGACNSSRGRLLPDCTAVVPVWCRCGDDGALGGAEVCQVWAGVARMCRVFIWHLLLLLSLAAPRCRRAATRRRGHGHPGSLPWWRVAVGHNCTSPGAALHAALRAASRLLGGRVGESCSSVVAGSALCTVSKGAAFRVVTSC